MTLRILFCKICLQTDKVKVAQSCPTLCDPMDYTVRGILQARILECIACPSPGALPKPGIKPRSPTLQADPLPADLRGKPPTDSAFIFKSFFTSARGNKHRCGCECLPCTGKCLIPGKRRRGSRE